MTITKQGAADKIAGVADVREIGLCWEGCEDILRSLSFETRIEVVAA